MMRRARRSDDGGLASLVLRAALGGTMIAHGLRHARTLDGTAAWFEGIGFRSPRLQARASSVVEVGSGVAVAAGLLTPISSAAMVGTMTVAYSAVHRPNGYFVVAEGWEYVGFISAAALALSALGPGPGSVDRRLGIDGVGRPVTRLLATAVLGAGGAAGQLALFWRPTASREGDR
jgi:putative oxidoreductase